MAEISPKIVLLDIGKSRHFRQGVAVNREIHLLMPFHLTRYRGHRLSHFLCQRCLGTCSLYCGASSRSSPQQQPVPS